MQSIMSVIINMNESKLKRKGKPKLLSELEQKKSWSGSQGKFAGHAKKKSPGPKKY